MTDDRYQRVVEIFHEAVELENDARKAFLDQAYDIYEERRALLLDSLKRSREGFLAFVFDTSDRIQHMFFRYQCEDHPANRGKDTAPFQNTIERMYARMDELVGELMKNTGDRDLLMIISDHGFKPFKWGVNLNSWLWRQGYLALNSSETHSRWLAPLT